MATIIVGTTLVGGGTQPAYLHLALLQRLDYNEAILALFPVSRTNRLLCYWASLVMDTITELLNDLTMCCIVVNNISSFVGNR